ncbi:hypothetical protein KEM54_001562 [Ascosphaera aggregata]|nr:hypothetical protein KEM54_001562 [Ascosphaera aggregata]
MFKLSSSRTKLLDDTDCPPSPTKSERGGEQKSIPTTETMSPAGELQQPHQWSAMANRPVPQPPPQVDGPGETEMDISHGNSHPQPAAMTSSRPSSPSKQHRKSDYLTGKRVLGLLRGTITRTDNDEREDSRENNDEELSPTKKKGSNVAALINVFNQRAGLMQSAQQQQQSQAHSHSHSQSLSQLGTQSNSQSSCSNQPQSTNKPLKPNKSWTQEDLDVAFEDLLEARNIPHNMREKMRSLDVNIKTDFICKHQHSDDLIPRLTAGGASTTTLTGPTTAAGSEKSSRSRHFGKKGKHASRSREDILDGKERDHRGRDKDKEDKDKSHEGTKSRRSRLRSRTFSRDSMRRPRSGSKPKRPKSIDFARPASVRSFGSNKSGHTSFSGSMNDGVIEGTTLGPEQPDDTFDPADFVHYLREVQKPEIVKVAKLHKLRLLLRNETVNWVDSFIWEGGMDEIIELIYRILAVEWREEHEDALLHELLLCLKALSTTSVGLAHLEDVEDKLFPTLLRMLFDDERKGPAEFTTRGLVTSLLFTHLSAPATEERAKRSDKILSFLRDPIAPKEDQPPTFIQNMHIVRPYKIWCREVTNTSREVFWIFLHHMNIIPLPKPVPKKPTTSRLNLAEFNSQVDLTQDSIYDEGEEEENEVRYIYEYRDPGNNIELHPNHHHDNQNRVYYHHYEQKEDEVPFCVKFYPPPRAPVPLAPYVGGVEWDATNYVASHLDLLNGLISTQPTLDKRNALRYDLQVSGFEKIMGRYLRTCKEKFYVAVHDALRLWVAAAVEDGWDVEQVRRGPRGEEVTTVGNVGVASVVRVGPPPPSAAAAGAAGGKRKKEEKRDEPPRVDIGSPTPTLGMDIENIGE